MRCQSLLTHLISWLTNLKYVFLVGVILLGTCFSQPKLTFPRSYLGKVHTPAGHLHILWIFVRYEDRSLFNNPKWPDNSTRDGLPNMTNGSPNHLFNKDPERLGQGPQRHNLSELLYNMSDGKFMLTGDVFPVQVPVKYIPEVRGNFSSRMQKMNQAAINWITENYPDFDWSKYDNRTNNPNFRFDNSESAPDSVLDYVVFMHRAPGLGGIGSPGSLIVPNTEFKIREGHTGIRCFAETEQNWQFFLHEFAHNMYNSPHYIGANSSDGERYYTQKGWGLMNFGATSFSTINAWESWWLGWSEPQEVTQAGEYILKDFATEHDALRINIPGTRDYLWIENHQKKDFWDDRVFYNNVEKGYPVSAPGIYMYVVGEQGTFRDNARLNPFRQRDVNIIKFLNAEGNFDYRPSGDSIDTEFFRAVVFEKIASNPFSGQNDFQFIRYDFDQNGEITVGFGHGNRDGGGREQLDIWAEKINGESLVTVAHTGDENDAFTVGDEIGLSGIIPITNYPMYNRKDQQLNPYLINGLRINILEQDDSGNIKLGIDFNDFELRKDSRWCGNLLLTADTSVQDSFLRVVSGTTLHLDHGNTPDRLKPDTLTNSFTNPTRLVIEKGRGLMIEKGAEVIVDNFSQLIMDEGAKLLIQKGGQLIIRNEGELVVNEDSELEVLKRGKIIKEETGKVDISESATLNFSSKAKLKGLDKKLR